MAAPRRQSGPPPSGFWAITRAQRRLLPRTWRVFGLRGARLRVLERFDGAEDGVLQVAGGVALDLDGEAAVVLLDADARGARWVRVVGGALDRCRGDGLDDL